MSEAKSLEEIKKFWPKSAPDVKNVSKYVSKYKNELIIIKYGGNVLIDRNVFNSFIEDIFILNMLNLSVVVVHGGGPRIEKELEKEKIQTKFLNGLRVTDKKVIKIVENVLIDFNNDIVNSLIKKGSNAVSVNTKVNNIISVIPDKEELGFVGIPSHINTDMIKKFINKNQIPVVAPLGLDANKLTYNINGDTAASAIAKKLRSRRLLLMTNVEGVYDDKKNLISEIKPFDIENLMKIKIVQGGMIPKIQNCIDAVEN
jgi:acetylglutamate kinase